MNTFDIGDRIEVFSAFTERSLTPAELKAFRESQTLPAGIGVKPGKIVCTVLAPDGTSSQVTVNEIGSSKVQVAIIEPDQHGTWYAAFDGSEGFQASGEHAFKVRRQLVPR